MRVKTGFMFACLALSACAGPPPPGSTTVAHSNGVATGSHIAGATASSDIINHDLTTHANQTFIGEVGRVPGQPF